MRKRRTARGRFRNTSTYTVAAEEASLLFESLVTPTIIPRIVQKKILISVTLVELIIAAFRKIHLESRLGSASRGHGLILNVLTLSMKSNSIPHRLSITGFVPSFWRKKTRSSR